VAGIDGDDFPPKLLVVQAEDVAETVGGLDQGRIWSVAAGSQMSPVSRSPLSVGRCCVWAAGPTSKI